MALRFRWHTFFNPSLVFCFIWIINYILLKLKVTVNIPDLTIKSSSLLIISMITSIVIFVIYAIFKKNIAIKIPNNFEKKIILEESSKISKVWLFILTLNVIYSGGFPLLSLILTGNSNYTDLGIPSIKGLTEALYFILFSIYAISYKELTKSQKIFFFFLMIYPILMLSRSIMMYAFLQVTITIMFHRYIKLKIILKSIILIGIIFFLFGYIGDIRTENTNPFFGYLSSNYDLTYSYINSSLVWLYVYITSPYGNIAQTIDFIEPTYQIDSIVYNLIPGAIKMVFDLRPEGSEQVITDASLNVASFYAGYLIAYGYIGAICGAILQQVIVTYLYFKALSGNLGNIIAFSVGLQCMLIGLFFDALLTIAMVFEILLALYLSRKIRSKSLPLTTRLIY